MALEELTVFAAGYWLAESRAIGDHWRMDLEGLSGIFQDALDLAWQLLLLAGLGWALKLLSLHLPQVRFVDLGLALVSAYGLSVLRRRTAGTAEPYFLALTVLALRLQTLTGAGALETLGMSARIIGGVVTCETVLLGLKERLRWSIAANTAYGAQTNALFCLALLAMIVWALRF